MSVLLNLFSDTHVTDLKQNSSEPCQACGKPNARKFTVQSDVRAADVVACGRQCAVKAAENVWNAT